MICWYCHWGWPAEVVAIYRKYEELLGDSDALDFGPGHIVWSDENFETEHIQWCIDNAEPNDLTETEFAAAVQSLRELLQVPESVRCCEPEEYDGEHPERYPPAESLRMVLQR